MKIKNVLHNFIYCLICFFLLITVSCAHKPPLKIGLITSLSGKFGDHGVEGRNAALLAIEVLNREGGLRGHQLELQIENDESVPEKAQACAERIHQNQINLIIGPFITGSATRILSYINNNKILTIGPTVAGDNLSHQDDYFIKLFPSTRDTALALSEYAVSLPDLKNFAALGDLNNKEFSDSWYDNFKTSIVQSGKTMQALRYFTSSQTHDYPLIVKNLLSGKPDAVLILAGSLDLAFLMQLIRKTDQHVQVFTASWGVTPDLIQNGGNSVDGILYYLPYDTESRKADYLAFKDLYLDRFGINPSFSGLLNYEAVMILAEGIRLADSFDPTGIRNALIRKKKLQGLQEEIEMDPFGDVKRSFILYTIKDHAFKRVQK